jgi:hypothetical protein
MLTNDENVEQLGENEIKKPQEERDENREKDDQHSIDKCLFPSWPRDVFHFTSSLAKILHDFAHGM